MQDDQINPYQSPDFNSTQTAYPQAVHEQFREMKVFAWLAGICATLFDSDFATFIGDDQPAHGDAAASRWSAIRNLHLWSCVLLFVEISLRLQCPLLLWRAPALHSRLVCGILFYPRYDAIPALSMHEGHLRKNLSSHQQKRADWVGAHLVALMDFLRNFRADFHEVGSEGNHVYQSITIDRECITCFVGDLHSHTSTI
jgi:hypothetical protein